MSTMKKTEEKTHYDVLELSSDASPNDIIKAYERAKEAYSPSSPALYTIFTIEETQELNQLIDTAFSVLSNPARKTEYDKTLSKSVSGNTKSELNHILEEVAVQADPNTAKTKFGTHAVDKNFEEQLKIQELFDGTALQKVRHYKNIDLDQLSDTSKISKSYILAIEAHDFDSLPAKVFVRGFVTQLAKLLELDPNVVVKSYMEIYDKNTKES